ncbi:MAG: mechanosensitive ion channel family protein [Herbaspirillum sp.]
MLFWKSLQHISVENWTIAALVTLISYLILRSVVGFVAGRMRALARRSNSRGSRVTAEVLLHPNQFILVLVSLLFGLSVIELPAKSDLWLEHGWVLAIGIQIALWLHRAINVWVRDSNSDDAVELQARATTTTLGFLLRCVLWLVTLLAILANLGVNVTALVASLGIGGIAIALALQNILSDLFASLSIAFDKPFVVGDYIVFGETQGTVLRVGVKTTRIRSLSGELVIISNTELLKQIVRNYQSMQQRRIAFGFRINYQTPQEDVAALPQIVKEIINAIDQTRFDRAHLTVLGDHALEFEVVYYVLDSNYGVYRDIHQRILLELMQACAAHNVQFGQVRTLQVTANAASMTNLGIPSQN